MKRIALFVVLVASAWGQPGAGKQAPPRSGREGAPADLTGWWVSPVMEDWRWRMVTPLKGDAASVPINGEARKIVDAWDPAKEEASGDQCKAYGAPGLMRLPGRLHITWHTKQSAPLLVPKLEAIVHHYLRGRCIDTSGV